MNFQGAVVALQGRGVGRGNSGSSKTAYSLLWLIEPYAWQTLSNRTHASRRRLKRSHHTSWRTRRNSTKEQRGGIPNWWGGRMPLGTGCSDSWRTPNLPLSQT